MNAYVGEKPRGITIGTGLPSTWPAAPAKTPPVAIPSTTEEPAYTGTGKGKPASSLPPSVPEETQPGETPITLTDITDWVSQVKQEVGVIRDLTKIPEQLLGVVVQTSLKLLGNSQICFEGENGPTNASGMKILEALRDMGCSPAQAAIVVWRFATAPKTPNSNDNLRHYPVPEVINTASNPHLCNEFAGLCDTAMRDKKVDCFFTRTKNPLDYAERLVSHSPHGSAHTMEAQAPQKRFEIHDLPALLSSAAGVLGISPQTAAMGAKQLVMIGAA